MEIVKLVGEVILGGAAVIGFLAIGLPLLDAAWRSLTGKSFN